LDNKTITTRDYQLIFILAKRYLINKSNTVSTFLPVLEEVFTVTIKLNFVIIEFDKLLSMVFGLGYI
jgi:hypothetical protein